MGTTPPSKADKLNALMARHFSHASRALSRWIEIRTKSGRTFRYELSEFPISPHMSADQAKALAESILTKKYRQCKWDKQHPAVDVEGEIIEGLTAFILENSKRLTYNSDPQPKRVATWAVIEADGRVAAQFPYAQRAEAEQYAQERERETGKPFRLEIVKQQV